MNLSIVLFLIQGLYQVLLILIVLLIQVFQKVFPRLYDYLIEIMNQVLEAWSAGKVVIARNNSGCKSLIHSGINGILFETPEECIQAIDKIVQDPNYRKELEKSSKEYQILKYYYYRYYMNGRYVEKEKNLLQQVIQSISYVC